MSFNRYDVHWVDLEPVRGSALNKTRPAVIVSLDLLNHALETVAVCPLTTRLHPDWRSRLPVTIGGRKAEVAADQIRAIGKSRLGKKIRSLKPAEIEALRRLLSEMYGEG